MLLRFDNFSLFFFPNLCNNNGQERISDICSNIGAATEARLHPEIEYQVHDFISMLHSGRDENFNRDYDEAHELYFTRLRDVDDKTD